MILLVLDGTGTMALYTAPFTVAGDDELFGEGND